MKFFGTRGYVQAAAIDHDDLDNELGDENGKQARIFGNRPHHFLGIHPGVFLFINGVFLCWNAIFWVMNRDHIHVVTLGDDLIIPPLRDIVDYSLENTDIHLGYTSPYGENTAEADGLWETISHDGPYGWISVSKEDLDAINQTSVKLSDGSGYLVGLEVFHEMHCLNLLRRLVLAREFKPEENPLPDDHLGHCIDILRLSLQCNANLSLMPMRWIEGYNWPWPLFTSTRQCRNWDDIVDWTKENSISVSGKLVHPKLGPILPGDLPDIKHLPHLDDIKFIDVPNS